MSILGKIMSSIFGSKAEASPAPTASGGASAPVGGQASSPTSTTTQSAEGVGQPGVAAGQPGTPTTGSAATGSSADPVASPQAGATGGQVDVAEILDAKVKEKGQDLNWRTSIVDLMKALDLDSSLSARKELADDLNYTGDTNDSATMNIWLHKQLMAKLAENGGKVPADLQA
jgi:hypothetical protein